jgi:ketosteroid isomerase-like protein
MKSLRLAGIVLCAAALWGQNNAADVAAVEAAEKGWAAAIQKKDFAALEKLLADDLIYNHSTGVVDTKQSYISTQKAGKLTYKSIEYSSMKVRIYGPAAVVNATIRIQADDQGKPQDNRLLLTHVFAKAGGQWRLVSHQSTRIPQ